MFWNLFERIINAVKGSEEPGQVSDASQPWSEDNPEQPTDDEQSFSSSEEPVGTTQPNEWPQ